MARARRPATLLATCILAGIGAVGAAAQSTTNIHLLELRTVDGRLTAAGAPVAVTDRAGYDNQPFFTPDGRLLFTSIRDDQADSYRYDPATGRTTRLTRTPESEYSPTPMPDARGFSVVRVEADSAQRLWAFAPDGSSPRLLLPGVQPVGYHAWIRDGLVALFVLGDPATLRIADTTTGVARIVADSIGRSLQAVPGAEAVTFTRPVDGHWWIREYDVATGAVRSVAPLLGPDEYHAWLPDGTLLTAHGTEVLAFDAGAGDWVAVADLRGLGPLTRLAASPDGRWLAVVEQRR